jgi:hypothetical protein
VIPRMRSAFQSIRSAPAERLARGVEMVAAHEATCSAAVAAVTKVVATRPPGDCCGAALAYCQPLRGPWFVGTRLAVTPSLVAASRCA